MSDESQKNDSHLGQDSVSRLRNMLANWRDKLVSFDGRNRQLFYRRLKSGDVDFNDKFLEPKSLELLLSGKSVKVSQLYPKLFDNIKNKTKLDLSIDQNLEDDLDDNFQESSIDFADLWSKQLRKYESVYRKAKENYDEKNIETCYIADGFITWETNRPGPIPNAPFLMHPIKIEPTARGNSDFVLTKTGDAFFNQALVLYLQKVYGISPSSFEDEEGNQPEVKSLLTLIKSNVKDFAYSEEKVLGNFSFLKYPMVEDINRIINAGTSHILLSALAGNSRDIQRISEIGSEESLERLSELNPTVESLIFPADSSQHSAISAVLGGKSVVIQGPPGSGKSQTIANLIAESVIQNKRILFVAEKRAAIDAVTERLSERGLGGVVLDLHGEPDKKTIAKNLLAAIKAHNLPPKLSSADEMALVNAKKRLNSRWKWLRKSSKVPNDDGGLLTNYDVLQRLGELRHGLNDKLIMQANLLTKLASGFSREKRDAISDEIRKLFDNGFFGNEYESSEAIKDFRSLQSQDEAEAIAKNILNLKASFDSPYWSRIKNLFRKAFKIQGKNINEFETCFEDLKVHTQFLTMFELRNLDEINSKKVCLLSTSDFRRATGKSFLFAYFAKRRFRSEFRGLQAKEWQKNDVDLFRLIEQENELLNKWSESKKGSPELEEVVLELDSIIDFVNQMLESIKQLQILVQVGSLINSNTFDDIEISIDSYIPVLDLIRSIPSINQSLKSMYENNLTSCLEVIREFNLDLSKSLDFWSLIWMNSYMNSSLESQFEWKDIAGSLSREVSIFQELDTKHLRSNTTKILSKLSMNFASLPIPEKTLLRRESEKNHSHLPFRALLNKIPDSIMKIKPVMAMSPLAVSRLLPCKEGIFDLVIFDEASQVKPEDAITSIYRGKQLVVAGDRFQLPPTSFGERTIEEDIQDWNLDDAELIDPATAGMESILTSAIGIFNEDGNVKPLQLHYRSRDERLISWSNFNIYRKAGEELFTFPSTDVESKDSLKYTYLPNVKTQSMSVANEAEIQEVKKAVLKHIENYPDLSLGIIAFGLRHSIRLQDEFNVLEKESDVFYNWKQSWSEKREKFFIKNIERVQGDERDSIIITPGYAPNLDGNVPLQFGTLNRQGGERRLNVAASRAKQYMHLITSIRSQDIDLKRSKSSSVALLRTYLEFMENQGRLVEAEYEFSVPTTPFEAEILDRLSDAGLTVDCQVGDSGFKIDFAVRDPKTNRYLLAIEADGATYHSSEYARERDYMRQRILENRGWRFIRIWSTDWWLNPGKEVQRVLNALNSSKTNFNVQDEIISKPEKVSAKYEEIEEFKILRAIKARNVGRSKEFLFELWFQTMGFQRRTQPLMNRFENYLRDLK